ncbi:MAG: HlyD family efflux transporter periplasmic adaptor subunit, partial [Calditrichales bacterium]
MYMRRYSLMKNIIDRLAAIKSPYWWIAAIIVAFLFGMITSGPDPLSPPSSAVETGTIWTCSMHPQVQQPGPGQCPICGMDLIPVKHTNDTGATGREISLSANARELARVQVQPIERKFVNKEIRMVGKVAYDETRVKYITARIPGRIDRMYVNSTGIPVNKGEHLVDIYSPDLLSTQQELIQAAAALKSSDSPLMQQNLFSIRDRLRLWGMTNQQIEMIETSGKLHEQMTIYAPMSGIVIDKNGLEGMYLDTGTRIYTIADLSHVWLELEVYESDLGWIRYGQEVGFETESYPGDILNGKISFIDPVLNERTRTIKVRVNVSNDDSRLKPGMFVHATVTSQVTAGGKVMSPELSGKWICPMHPEVVKNKAGICDVCGMPLVKPEKLGYVAVENMTKEAALVVPASAVLITGKRAIVYIEVAGKTGVYEGREIVLGPRAGDYYLVKSGLQEGEMVVVNGSFKIDSAIQIFAGPSMMSAEAPTPEKSMGPDHDTDGSIRPWQPAAGLKTYETDPVFKAYLDKLYAAYFVIQFGLSHDDFAKVKSDAQRLKNLVDQPVMPKAANEAHMTWMKYTPRLRESMSGLVAA